ncbi:MAG: hydrogenase expression/formation protein HypE [Promethearchaeota archaeon]
MGKNLFKLDETVKLGHGAGGRMSQDLIDFLVSKVDRKDVNGGVGLLELDDGAAIPIDGAQNLMVITSDGHTVDPIIFPGGDIGKLSACGTINDVLMLGATPTAITNVLMIEEGLTFETLKIINDSFINVLNEEGIALIAGDTKVMPRGSIKGCIGATTGIGIVSASDLILDSGVQPGDDIVVTGTLGDHETALLACREGLGFDTELVSDVQVLSKVVAIAKKYKPHAMKDPTRGGLATALNEFSTKSNVGIWLDESAIPFKKTTTSACNMLGLDPYELASEGRAVIAVPAGTGQRLVDELKKIEGCSEASVIGTASKERRGKVLVRTSIGGTRFLPVPIGEPIPRVC